MKAESESLFCLNVISRLLNFIFEFNKPYSHTGTRFTRYTDAFDTAHLQHGDFLAITQQAERKGVFVIEARADLAATERQRGDVALQVISVLMEEQLVVFQAAPTFPPAVVGQNVQVTCIRKQKCS